jgi:alpha-2-macroglobulin
MKTALKCSILLFLCLIVAATTLAGETAQVERFSPQGTVKEIRQVTVRFSSAMVPFGDPRLEDPLTVQCPAKGKGRWVDDKTWVYDFEKELPAGTTCRFHLKEDLKNLSGQSLSGSKNFTFNTGGPSVIGSRPEEGHERIDENQVFIFSLDTEPEEASVLEKAFFVIEGVREQVGLKLIKGPEKEKLLKALKFKSSKAFPLVFQCRQSFPANAQVKIIWGKGLKSKSGLTNAADQVLAFKTRRPFTARFIGRREKPNAGCIPLLPMQLFFSAPVAWETAKQIRLKSQTGKTWKPKAEEDGGSEYVNRVIFEGPFPENQNLTLHLPPKVQDDSGRLLSNQNKFPMLIKTDHYPSLAKFGSRFGILELNEGALLPLTVRNIETEIKGLLAISKVQSDPQEVKTTAFDQTLKAEHPVKPLSAEQVEKDPQTDENIKGKLHQIRTTDEEKIIDWLRRLRIAKRAESIFKDQEPGQKLSIPKPGGSKEFEVIGIPLKGPGFFVVELESKMLGSRLLAKPAPMVVPTGALVTDLSAHFQWGRESSLVWATTLEKGEPVAEAAVTIRDCAGKKVWEGKTDENGIAKINKALPSVSHLRTCSDTQEEEEYSQALSGIRGGLFVFVKKAGDLTFIHSSWNQGIETWRFNIPGGPYSDGDRFLAHTVLDRTLFRAGEEVHMKHFVRQGSIKGLTIPPDTGALEEVTIQQVGSDQPYFLPLKWRANGTAESVFKIPPQAKLGTYEIYLGSKAKDPKGGTRPRFLAGSFRVEEFRVPLMKAMIQGPSEPIIQVRETFVDLAVSYLSGGGAADLPVKLRTEINPLPVHFPDYDDYTFANGRIKPGIQKTESYDDEYYEEDDDEKEPEVKGKKGILHTIPLTLDKQGMARTTLSGLPETDTPQNILTELEFKDPNGEIQTVSSRIPRYPSNRLVGLGLGSKGPTAQSLPYQIVVLDLQGRPIPRVEVKTRLFQRKVFSHRRRLTGGFYAYGHINEIKAIGPGCQGRTDPRGLLFCDGKPPVTGQVIIEAETVDDNNNPSVTHHEVWIPGKDDQWVEVGNDDRIDLLPDLKKVESGDKARFQIKMPFKEATALITVAREGIIDAFVRKIDRSDPFFEIPIKDNYAPNVFVSAMLVRGRLAQTRPTAMFDPGKPAYKLGLTEIQVGWKPHELKVEVVPEKKTYAPRETVMARIRVRTATGAIPPKGSEAVFAVVDEGLLELKPNESWKLLEAMMKKKGCEVETSTAQMMVIGKRHFGRKALPHGGGGGRQLTRELFDTLVFWKGAVPLDDSGEALVHFTLNDSLTAFRLVAVASGGEGLFGTGASTIRTSQDLIVLSGIPPLVREKDRFKAGLTVRNTSANAMKIEVKMTTTPVAAAASPEPIILTLAAGEAREIGWPITIPSGIEKLNYTLEAGNLDGPARDTLKVSQKVIKAVPLRTFQATLTQIKGPLRLEVERPGDALPGQGGITLLLKPKISEGLLGLTDYMKQYPYTCLEQKISRSVVLKDREGWNSLMAELPSYLDGNGLAKYFPVMHQGSDALTAYLLAISQEAGRDIPPPVRQKMIRGLLDFIEGKVIRYSALPTADLSLRKMSAIEALSRYGKADPGLLSTVAIEPNLWPTSALLDWLNTLERVKVIPDRSKKMKEAEQILRSRFYTQGTDMSLSTERRDHLWWLMTTPDTNAVKALLATLPIEGWKNDHPRIAAGLVRRMKRGRWDTTTANAWGLLALEKFSALYESVPVTGLTEVSRNGKTEFLDWEKSPKGTEIKWPWPEKKEGLTVTPKGSGSPWATVQSVAAIPLKQPLSSGFQIKKILVPIEQKTKHVWSKGDVVRIRLELESQADMTWVVVHDPIPAGSMILGSGLGRDSGLLIGDEQERGRAWETFRERSFEALKVYYEYVPKGKWTVEYTLRLNNDGVFHLPETRVEALYAPEMFGELPNKPLEVGR